MKTKWLYKALFLLFSKLAEWAREKAGIPVDQHDEAEKGTKKIEDASKGKDYVTVDPKDRPDNDVFDNNDWSK